MAVSVSEVSHKCLKNLSSLCEAATKFERTTDSGRTQDLLGRFRLWSGNIGALHHATSSLSLENRLSQATNVLNYVLDLLSEIGEVTDDLLDIAQGTREGSVVPAGNSDNEEAQYEEVELLNEISAAITALFRVTALIRQVAPVDLFQKALSRDRYRFNSQYDIAYVGEKFPKLALESSTWLQRKLGEAITRRRHYLGYMRDHHAKLAGPAIKDTVDHEDTWQGKKRQDPVHETMEGRAVDGGSRPDTFFTEVTAVIQADAVSPEMLVIHNVNDAPHEEDAKSYTTITRSVDGDTESSTTLKIPKLEDLQKEAMGDLECPFCFRIVKFRSQRQWRRHVFSDLRAYVCTFPNCEVAYFDDIDDWFQHEMQCHRVQFDCQICSDKTFIVEDHYLAHVRSHHPELLKDGNQSLVLSIAKRPLTEIPTEQCPCCSDWTALARATIVDSDMAGGSQDIVCATPRVFRRHLATHLEQLALFAVPLPADYEDDAESNAALVTFDPSDQLDALFLNEGSGQQPYTELQIEEVAKLLSHLKPQWSANPRTYIILRTLDHLELLDEFLEANLSDYFIPYDLDHLQSFGLIKNIELFEKAQKLVLSAFTAQSVLSGRHCCFDRNLIAIHLQTETQLSRTRAVEVEVVKHTSSGISYVRKLSRRFRNRWTSDVQFAITDIRTLKQLNHPNIIQYFGSFTTPLEISCFLTPAAEETLDNYLAHAEKPTLRKFFGCLVSAAEYLHGEGVVHADIKPANVLLYKDTVLLTDFSVSSNLRDSEDGQVHGPYPFRTRRYCAPEMLNREPKGTSVDIWSLGLVFSEMYIALKGTLVELRRESVHSEATAELIKDLRALEQEGSPTDNVIVDWICSMLSVRQEERITAFDLKARIWRAQEHLPETTFFGSCCCLSNSSSDDDANSEEKPEGELQQVFVRGSSERYSDREIEDITILLRKTKPALCDVPRTYITLREINRLDILDEFIKAGYSDYWIPFSDRGFPRGFGRDVKAAFLQAQTLVLSQSIELKKDQHAHFDHEDDIIPFQFVETLGSGSFGHISRAISRFDRKEYALRRWPRDKRKKHIEMSEMLRTINEINILRRLNHRHIIKFAGSYTDLKFICCVVSPVADTNLLEFLDRAQPQDYQTVRSFFGCLTTAVKYLHDEGIRHGNISPKVLLVADNKVFLSAFGLSLDYNRPGSDVFAGRASINPRSRAPELSHSRGQRWDMKSDMWSLAIVFLDMVAALKGRRSDDTAQYFERHGSEQIDIHANIAALPGYLEELGAAGDSDDAPILVWIERMLSVDPTSRPDTATLLKMMTWTAPSNEPNLFFGACCS